MSSLLNIGMSGLTSAQVALNVTAQNIANVNTVGYSRQEATFGALAGFGRLDNGMGVGVTGVSRITDPYLVTQHWRGTSSIGASYANYQYLNTAEQMFASESMSLTVGFDSFFGALNAAVDSPESNAPRSQIISSGNALANRFHQLEDGLVGQQSQIDEQLGTSVKQVNSYLVQVAEMNKQIAEQKGQGVNTAALEDSRDQAVGELSSLMEVRVNRLEDGTYELSLPQGQPLVVGSSASELKLAGNDLKLDFNGQSFDVPKIHSGSMAGIIEYRDDTLGPLFADLDAMAVKIADEFNAMQTAGVDLNGNPGKPMFEYDPLDPAGSLKIADGFEGEDLAFAKAGGGPGDNSNLQNMLTIKDGQYDAYTKLVGDLAVKAGQAGAVMEADMNMEMQQAANLSSVSGVNLDEEGMKIMSYTQLYQANAKVISTADQLFSSIINMF
ncbi:MAG: flagellar hook-associated protein FlgK [Aeromonas sp.]